MTKPLSQKQLYKGLALAVLAALIWSGNFVVARGVSGMISPVSLAFYRWLIASLIILPLAARRVRADTGAIAAHWKYLFWVALSGIALFNTFIYIAGKSTSAINLAIIGTTSSPVMATFLAAIFLQETITPLRITGMITCIAGILLLLSGGSWEILSHFRFSHGDWWILAAALMFAVYNVLTKRKPAAISPLSFLCILFCGGTLLLLPAYLWEWQHSPAVHWSPSLLFIIFYLGLGASVLAYLCWNAAIARLGVSATALFGNLIPIFSTLEAVLILNEKITSIHLISGLLVIAGLIIANSKRTGRN
jgi:drug/metabolite transporter (DMT)-like permease